MDSEGNSTAEIERNEAIDEDFAPLGPPVDRSDCGTLVAPVLRVEELRDDAAPGVDACGGGYSSGSPGSSIYGTDDDECPASGEEASDRDGVERPSGQADPDFEVPSEELRRRIVDQVEFFFSDENLGRDAFMLKHVRRNRMGYVSLKLVTSFRKVKSLTKDHRVVAHCLESSEKLELNEEGTKIRRKEPIPDYDETGQSRTIVAANLPVQNPNVEDVAELFSKFGDVALIRILRPGKPVPQDVKNLLVKHPDLADATCAVIEYEKHESAKAALEMTNDGSGDAKKEIRVILLAAPKKEKANKEDRSKKEESARETAQQKGGKKNLEVNRMTMMDTGTSNEEVKKVTKTDEHGRIVTCGRSSLIPVQDPNRLSPGGSPRTTPRSSPKSSPRSSPRASPTSVRRRSSHGPSPLAAESGTTMNQENQSRCGYESPSQSPWIQRRLKVREESSLRPASPSGSGTEGPKSLDMLGALRQPKGPDGTKGFSLLRSNVDMS